MQRSQLSKSAGESKAGDSPGSDQPLRISSARRFPSGVSAGSRPFGGSTMRVVCRCGVLGSVTPERSARPILALLDQLPPEVPAAGGGGDALLVLLFRPPRLVHVARRAAEAGRVRTPFQRDAGGLHHVQVGLDVGFTPRRLRVDPALRSPDEVVGLAWRPENRLAVRGHEENRSRRGTEQGNAHRLHDSHSLRHAVLGVRCEPSCADWGDSSRWRGGCSPVS